MSALAWRPYTVEKVLSSISWNRGRVVLFLWLDVEYLSGTCRGNRPAGDDGRFRTQPDAESQTMRSQPGSSELVFERLQ